MPVTKPDLELTQVVVPNPVFANDPLQFALTVRNIGPSSATGIVVEETLPPGVTFVEATSSRGRGLSRAGEW